MASKTMKPAFVRHIVTRGYAQACVAPTRLSEAKIVSGKVNNVWVASVDNGNPCTRIAISFKGGSRYEPASELGLSHVLRSAAGLTTKTATEFIIKRNLAQIGATITATSDREFITYTLEVAKSNLREAIKFLNTVVSEQEFRQWELDENVDRLEQDIVTLTPQVRTVDLLHKAAYRRGLGNSLFISPKRIGKISSESLQHFTSNYLTASRCAITVVGDNQDRAATIANCLNFGNGTAEETATRYSGGELRKEMGGELAHVALAVEGAKAGSPEALALAVAAKALGNGPAVKWGNDNSILAKAIGNIGPFAAAGFNITYSDSGLYGVILSVPKDEAASAVKAVAGVLKTPSLPSEMIKRGKNQLRLEILDEENLGTSLAENINAQALYTGEAKTPREIAAAVEQLSEADVNKALNTVSKSKLSLGAAGNIVNVPYLDEI